MTAAVFRVAFKITSLSTNFSCNTNKTYRKKYEQNRFIKGLFTEGESDNANINDVLIADVSKNVTLKRIKI